MYAVFMGSPKPSTGIFIDKLICRRSFSAPPSPLGAECLVGSAWRDACNECRCTRAGRRACTERACPPGDPRRLRRYDETRQGSSINRVRPQRGRGGAEKSRNVAG
ncbi:hypothetical protein EVAR_97664_1 [Eumeta japonica]|uniref:Pacifastin domain-containing protein n=1 Tax=Eumeta variegata TaxID=151549 RepID=A0A4C1WX59_EUMVA|nr:hypothetical protein EVAR_97664_1 [Eumeta japonica]